MANAYNASEEPVFDSKEGVIANFTDEPIDDMAPHPATPDVEFAYSKAIIKLGSQELIDIGHWVSDQLTELTDAYEEKRNEWAAYESAYKAFPEENKPLPFIGASTDRIPLIASMIDPVHARLDLGVFKQSPPFRMIPLRKQMMKYAKALEKFINYYNLHVIGLRKTSSPRLLEMAKLGTCVFYVDFRKDERSHTYMDGEKIKKEKRIFAQGPIVEGVELSDFLFPGMYQHIQHAPLVARRIRTTIPKIRMLEKQGWLTNVDKVEAFGGRTRTTMEDTQEEVSGVRSIMTNEETEIELFEVFFRYDCDGDGEEEMLRGIVHLQTSGAPKGSPVTIMQLRYNDAAHGCYPFVVMNYTINNQSLLGTGLCEMIYPFQESVSRYQQLAMDNAFIANAKMFVAKRGTPGLEGDIRVYGGKTFYVEDPGKDLTTLSMGDIYPSTLTERQNLLGLAEKRSGVTDYMIGRESPVIGSRATATSTLALIQEGTKRVEQVMENIRTGFTEMIEMQMQLFAQYGVWDLAEYQFGSEEEMALVHEFFTTIAPKAQLSGAFSISIGVTDATTNKQVQQQMQLALINLMQGYFKQLIEVGQLAMNPQMQSPQFIQLIKEVINSAHSMFRDLLDRYDIPNAEEYLPDVVNLIAPPPPPAPMAPSGPDASGQPGAPSGNGQPNPLAGLDALLAGIRGGPQQGAPAPV